ncbi:MAG TPA: DUF4184 family protein [Candidatus Eisenbacteria bacterium]|nr:DUF4184 family protein [Candidatus Eisenbacteria bacterium]
MPFTLSHAAAALPFRRFRPVWPALVVGTFAPDLQYFIWISDEDRSGHHLPNVLLFTLPLALVVLWVFERIVKGPLIELLPSGFQRRLQDKLEPLYFQGGKQFVSILVWIAVGIFTHLVWDQFTHSHTRVTTFWQVLSSPVAIPFLHAMPLSKILQHASSVAGLLVLCAWCAHWYLHTPPVPKSQVHEFTALTKLSVALAMIAIALLAGYPYAIHTLSGYPYPIRPIVFIVTVFEAVTMFICIELLLYSIGLNVATRSRRVAAAQLDETAR